MRHGAAELEINFAILQLCNSHFFSHQTSTLLEWKWHNELILLHNIFMSHKIKSLLKNGIRAVVTCSVSASLNRHLAYVTLVVIH